MKILYLSEYNLLSIKDFCHVRVEDRIKINNSIEENLSIFIRAGGKFWDGSQGIGNFPLDKDETLFFSHIYENFKDLCYKLFGNFHLSSHNQTTCWCCRSNIKESICEWHNHLYTSTINGVYYYQVEGDGIFFKRNGKEFHYIPQQGELLIFPNDLDHKPAVATSETQRYSLNMELITQESASTLFKNLYGLS